jgi:hypothetical protein
MDTARTELTARERLVLEFEEIKTKCEKLKMFLCSDIYNKLTIEEQVLLNTQFHLMQSFAVILNRRLELFKDKI